MYPLHSAMKAFSVLLVSWHFSPLTFTWAWRWPVENHFAHRRFYLWLSRGLACGQSKTVLFIDTILSLSLLTFAGNTRFTPPIEPCRNGSLLWITDPFVAPREKVNGERIRQEKEVELESELLYIWGVIVRNQGYLRIRRVCFTSFKHPHPCPV